MAEALANLAWERHRERLGVDATMISKWERGVKRPRKLYRRLFCALYGATEEDLGLRPAPVALEFPLQLVNPANPVRGGMVSGSLEALVGASTSEATALVSAATAAGESSFERRGCQSDLISG